MPDRAVSMPPENRRGRLAGRISFEPGDLIAERYRVIGSLRPGRLDEAYQVEDVRSGERLALRVLRRANRRLSPGRSLTRTINRLSRLRHPNVARVHELAVHVETPAEGEIESALFITSELVEGETLGSFVRNERPLERGLAMSLIHDICSGLAAVHRSRIVHGDLSSATIILSRRAGAWRPVITDFAFAPDEDHEGVTSIGSPVYRAPETIVGQPRNKMSDVFSLGAVIYEVLSGRIPFTGGNLLALDFRPVEEEPRPLREVVEDLDPRLERIVSRCLDRGPEDRYANASEVQRALQGADFWTPRTRRNVSTLSAAAALVVVMFGGSALLDRVSELERAAAIETTAYRPSLAILDLAPTGTETEPWIGVALGELIRDDFSRDASVRVAEHELVQEYAGITIPSVGVPDNDVAARIRTLFDVEAIVIGTYSTDISGGVPSVALDLCVIDARSGETLAASFERGSPESLPELAARTGARLRASIGIPESDTTPISWDPDAVQPWATGLLLLTQYRIRGGVESLEKAAAVQPGNPRVHDALTLAWSRVGSGRHATASARRAVELSGRNNIERTLERIATLSALEGDLPRALDARGKLARAFPDRVAHVHNLIDTLLLAGATRPAAEEIRLLRTARVTVDPRTEILDARLNSQIGRFEEAASHAERAVAIARMTGSTNLEGEALIELAWAHASRGSTDSALARLTEAASALRQGRDSSGLARVASIRAGIRQRTGDLDAALSDYVELSGWYRSTGQDQSYATTLGSRATILSLQGRHEGALVLLEEATGHFVELDDELNIVRSLGVSGGELLALGRLSAARERFAAANETAQRRTLPAWEGYARTGLARVAIEDLDLQEAERQIAQASSIFGSVSLGSATANLDLVRSDLDRLRGHLADAESRLTGMATSGRETLDRERQAQLHHSLASIALSSGRNDAALALAMRAVDYYASAGNLDQEADCLTIAYAAAVKIRDAASTAELATRLDALVSRLESPLRSLRIRLVRAEAWDQSRARNERMAVFERSSALRLGLVRLEAAHALMMAASGKREHDRWQAVVAETVRDSGASIFLERH